MHSSANNISDKVVRNLNKLVHEGQTNRFKESFNDLSYYHKQCYLRITIAKCRASVMRCILSSVEKDEIFSVFYALLREEKGFAFSTLDVIAHQSPLLFRALFNRLNSQQKEDYKIHLETKQTVSAKHILERFYSNDKRRLKAENSNAKNPNIDNRLLEQRKQPIQNGFFTLKNSASPSSHSTTLEETVDQHEIESPTVNGSLASEKISSESDNQSFDELIYWITGEQLSNSPQLSILEKFNELEEIRIEPLAKRQRIKN